MSDPLNPAPSGEDADTRIKTNRKIIERYLLINSVLSMATFGILARIYRNSFIVPDHILSILAFYPEKFFIKASYLTLSSVLSSNIFCLIHIIACLLTISPEVIHDKYLRQDRRQLSAIAGIFFYLMRDWMLFLFQSEPRQAAMTILFPTVTIVASSMLMVSLYTVEPSDRDIKTR